MDFFSKGFLKGSIPSYEADRLLLMLKNEEFSEGDRYREDPSLSPPQAMTKASEALLKECQAWSSYSVLRSIQENFGAFSYWFCTANRFNGGRGMMWHNDHIDASFATILIYLTEHEWIDDFGGCLEIGKVKDARRLIEPRLSKSDTSIVETVGKVVPNHGTTVVLNNLTLPFCHQVTPTMPSKVRHTLMFHFGYWENTRNARRDFGFSKVSGRTPVEGS